MSIFITTYTPNEDVRLLYISVDNSLNGAIEAINGDKIGLEYVDLELLAHNQRNLWTYTTDDGVYNIFKQWLDEKDLKSRCG